MVAAATPPSKRRSSSAVRDEGDRVVHRHDQLRASRIMQQRAFDDEKIEFRWNTVVTEVLGDESSPASRSRHGHREASALGVTGVFVAIGHEPNTSLVKGRARAERAARRPHDIGSRLDRGRVRRGRR